MKLASVLIIIASLLITCLIIQQTHGQEQSWYAWTLKLK